MCSLRRGVDEHTETTLIPMYFIQILGSTDLSDRLLPYVLTIGITAVAFLFWLDAGQYLRSAKNRGSEIGFYVKERSSLEEKADSVIQSIIESMPAVLWTEALRTGWTFRKWSREYTSNITLAIVLGYRADRSSIYSGPIMIFLGTSFRRPSGTVGASKKKSRERS